MKTINISYSLPIPGIENASLATQLNEYNTKLLERNSLVSHSSVQEPLVREMDKSWM